MKSVNDASLDSDKDKLEQLMTDSLKPENDLTQTQAKPSEPTAEPTPEYVWEYEGKKYTVDELKSLRDGGMMKDDYTRKTQELAIDRGKVQQAINKIAEKMIAIKQYDPELHRFMLDESELPNRMPPDLSDDDREIWQLKREVEQLKTDFQNRQYQSVIEQGFSTIKGDYNRAEVEKYMYENQVSNPTVAYRAMRTEQLENDMKTVKEKARKEVEAEYRAKLTQAQRDALGNAPNSSTSHELPKPVGDTLADSIEFAVKKSLLEN